MKVAKIIDEPIMLKRCFIALNIIAFLIAAAVVAAGERRYKASVERPYEDVLEDVKFAISEKNFRLTGGNRIGGAISERHEEESLPESEVVHFCNLEYARKFLQSVPDYVRHMPCKVVIYENKDQVVVETELLPEDDPRVAELAEEVNQILRFIVDYATEQ
jgi:uncharacterized protein (DUF302 family)